MKRNLFEYEKIIIWFLPYTSYNVITLLSFPFLNEKLWTLRVLVLKRFGRKLTFSSYKNIPKLSVYETLR